jgi:hypothetical protein
MEAAGSGRLTTNLFDTGKVVIGTHVGDNDSSCRMLMCHSFQDLIDEGKMESAAWSRYKGKGKIKKPNDGLLPVLHPPIVFKGDKGHRVRNQKKSTTALVLDDIGIMFDRLLGWLLKWSCSNQNAMLVPLSAPLFCC